MRGLVFPPIQHDWENAKERASILSQRRDPRRSLDPSLLRADRERVRHPRCKRKGAVVLTCVSTSDPHLNDGRLDPRLGSTSLVACLEKATETPAERLQAGLGGYERNVDSWYPPMARESQMGWSGGKVNERERGRRRRRCQLPQRLRERARKGGAAPRTESKKGSSRGRIRRGKYRKYSERRGRGGDEEGKGRKRVEKEGREGVQELRELT